MKINPIYCQLLKLKNKSNQNNTINKSAVAFTGPAVSAEQELANYAVKFAKGNDGSIFPLLLRDTKLPRAKAEEVIHNAIKSQSDISSQKINKVMNTVITYFNNIKKA